MLPTEAIRMKTLRHILVNERDVEYCLLRSKSATKIRIKVKLDELEVVVPETRSLEEGTEFLRKNGAWVSKQLERVQALRTVRRPFLRTRGRILWKGEPVEIRVILNQQWNAPNKVELIDGVVLIVGNDKVTKEALARSLESWFRKQARKEIDELVSDLGKRLMRLPNRVYVMGQRTKWGNCSALGNLSFNWKLLMAPEYVLRYIVTHEMVHLAIPDHSQKFWFTVRGICKESERARQWLVANEKKLTEWLGEHFIE